MDPSNTTFREEKWTWHEEEVQGQILEMDINVQLMDQETAFIIIKE